MRHERDVALRGNAQAHRNLSFGAGDGSRDANHRPLPYPQRPGRVRMRVRVRATLMTGDGDRVRGNSWSGASQKTGDGDSGQAASVRQTTDLHSLPALWKRAGCVRLPVGPRLINKPQSSSGPGRFAASSGPLRSGAERILCGQASAVAYAVVRPHSGHSRTASSRSRARSHFRTPKARESILWILRVPPGDRDGAHLQLMPEQHLPSCVRAADRQSRTSLSLGQRVEGLAGMQRRAFRLSEQGECHPPTSDVCVLRNR